MNEQSLPLSVLDTYAPPQPEKADALLKQALDEIARADAKHAVLLQGEKRLNGRIDAFHLVDERLAEFRGTDLFPVEKLCALCYG